MKKILFFLIVFIINIKLVNAQWAQTSCPVIMSGYTFPIITQGLNVYVGGNSGIFLSSDNGNNWTNINNGLTNYYVNSFAINDSSIFAGTDDGVYISNNNGGLWTQINNGLTGTLHIKSIATIGNKVFALSTYNGISQLFYSNNNGQLWTFLNNLPTSYIYSTVTNDSNVYILSYNGVYISTDYGNNWNIVNNSLPTDGSVISLAFSGNNIYAGTNNGMYLSTDNNNSWTFLNNSQNLFILSISINDTNIYVGTQHGVYASSDNGFNWAEFNTGFGYDTTIYYLANNGTYIFSSDTINIWRRPLSDIISNCQVSFQYTNIAENTYLTTNTTISDSSAYPITFTWNFGDGTFATTYADTIYHTYNTSENIACLTIQTASGCTSTYCDSIYINTNTPCQAEFLYNATLLYCGPYCVQFFDSSYAASAITSWLWTFSDSTSSTLQNPSHTFPGYGSYNVCLTIQTANGCSSTNCQQINVQYPAFCQAGFSYYLDSLNTTNPYTFNFVNQSTTDSLNTIVGFSWSFSDGTNSTLANPTHVFNFTANYEVCLTITTANGCTNTYCDSVLVTNAPCTIFASVNTQSPSTIGGNDGYIESSTSGGTPPYSYNWSNNETTQNIYNLTSGGYILTITDANGCQNILSAALYEPYDTTGGPIVDTLYTNVIDTCLNFVPDSFYVSSIVIDTVNQTATITWTFSNNSQTSSVTAIYIYTQLGNNMIVLTLNCGTKTLTTYQSYVHITSNLSAPVNNYYTNISAYPVPFNDKLIINYTSQKSDNTTILLMDATGRIVVSEKIISIIGSNYSEINTSQLPSGIYILSIETKDGIFRKQVVK